MRCTNDSFNVRLGYDSGGPNAVQQPIRADGVPVIATVTTSDPVISQLLLQVK